MAKKLFFCLIFAALAAGGVFAQTYKYYISSGSFKADGWSASCYSGAGEYKNDPSATSVKNQGPIPAGEYYIVGIENSKGPNTIRLAPRNEKNMYGRSGFLIHGDNSTGTASSGCIVMGPAGRETIRYHYRGVTEALPQMRQGWSAGCSDPG